VVGGDRLYEREIAGVAVGGCAALLIFNKEYAYAMALLVGMLSFFMGEKNGQRKAENKTQES